MKTFVAVFCLFVFLKIILGESFPFYPFPVLKSSSSQRFKIYVEEGLGAISLLKFPHDCLLINNSFIITKAIYVVGRILGYIDIQK